MTVNTAEIRLAHPATFARPLQLAAIGFMFGDAIRSGLAEIDLREGRLKVDPALYAEAARETLTMIQEASFDPKGPKLYKRGNILDSNLLFKEFLSRSGPSLSDCDDSTSWKKAAECYLQKVIINDGPLGGHDEFNLPALASLTVFGRLRGLWRKSGSMAAFKEFKKQRVNSDSLGLVLVGGMISLLASYTVKENYNTKRKTIEIYLIPSENIDTLTSAEFVYSTFHTLSAKTLYSFKDLIIKMIKNWELRVSGDILIQLAIYMHLADIFGYLEEADVIDPYSGYYVITVNASGNRPQGLSAYTINAYSIYRGLGGEVAEQLASCFKLTERLKDKNLRRQVYISLSRCIHNIYMFLWSQNVDYVFQCTRLIDQLIFPLLKEKAVRLASKIDDLVRVLRSALVKGW